MVLPRINRLEKEHKNCKFDPTGNKKVVKLYPIEIWFHRKRLYSIISIRLNDTWLEGLKYMKSMYCKVKYLPYTICFYNDSAQLKPGKPFSIPRAEYTYRCVMSVSKMFLANILLGKDCIFSLNQVYP